MVGKPFIEYIKKLLDANNIGYFFGAEVLHEVGRPYLYHFNLYAEDVTLYVRQDTNKVYSVDKLPQRVQEIVDIVNFSQGDSFENFKYAVAKKTLRNLEMK